MLGQHDHWSYAQVVSQPCIKNFTNSVMHDTVLHLSSVVSHNTTSAGIESIMGGYRVGIRN